ncbi:MAG TPA: MFS transporter, partial [Thermodesulfovibrionales bacterium]|nr:MFS transporter [Thermodesulfovibrionales bacterium]
VFWLSMIPGIIAVLLIILFIKEKQRSSPLSSERPKLSLRHFDWRFKFFVLIATLFAVGNSSDVFLILRARQTGIPSHTIPMLYLVFNVIYSLSAVPAGIVADRFGRKRVILAGFILFAVVYFGFAMVERTATVWVLFALYGVFMGLTDGTQKAFLAGMIPADFKATAFGLYHTAVGLAMFPASLAGGWLWDHFSPSATFYYGACTACLSCILFIVFMAATRESR